MNNPLLTFIIPVYNAENYLEKCIDSILRQKRNNNKFEIILINDGSTDNTYYICNKYKYTYNDIKVFHTANKGVSSARNLGIEKAKGYWISFIDADDYISENYIEVLLHYCYKADITFFSNHTIENNKKKDYILPDSIYRDRKEIENCIYKLKSNKQNYDFFGYTWNKVFKRDIIIKYKIRFNTALYIKEDEVFTSNYIKHISSLQTIQHPLYYYQINYNSLTYKEKPLKMWLLLASLMVNNLRQYKNVNLLKIEIERVFKILLHCQYMAKNNLALIKVDKLILLLYQKYNSFLPRQKIPVEIIKASKYPRIINYIYLYIVIYLSRIKQLLKSLL